MKQKPIYLSLVGTFTASVINLWAMSFILLTYCLLKLVVYWPHRLASPPSSRLQYAKVVGKDLVTLHMSGSNERQGSPPRLRAVSGSVHPMAGGWSIRKAASILIIIQDARDWSSLNMNYCSSSQCWCCETDTYTPVGSNFTALP